MMTANLFERECMTERQQLLLRLLVETHIRHAEPVSSHYLADASALGVSSATIRNDLAELEENGYIRSPHTSSGRVPTEKGYRFYIEWFVGPRNASQSERRRLEEGVSVQDPEIRAQQLADALSDLTGSMVILSFAPERSYATGLSRVLQLPEFHDFSMILRLGRMIDGREAWIHELRTRLHQEIAILLGDESPFGDQIASITLTYRPRPHEQELISLVGPLRMDYQHNLSILHEMRELLESYAR